jgi:D-xylose transport system substrate-binding protein
MHTPAAIRTPAAVCVLGLALALSACGHDAPAGTSAAAGKAKKPIKIGVILPENDTSPRWESFDRPFLQKYLKAEGLEPIIQNAQGDEQRFSTLADQMIADHVQVLILTSTNSEVGSAIEAKAKAQHIPTIDYDRVNLGGTSDYYVSFDNQKIGELQAQALTRAVGDKQGAQIIQIEGSPTDNNATQFAAGHKAVLKSRYDSGQYKLVGEKFADKWNNEAGGNAFEQILTGNKGKVDGVVAANDGLGLAVVTVLKKYGLAGKVPVTGQDATPEGLQAVLRGDLYMTIFKPIDQQAQATAKLAAALARGDTRSADAIATDVLDDPVGRRKVKSVLLGAQIITKDRVKVVTDAKFVSVADVCVKDVAAACGQLGIK